MRLLVGGPVYAMREGAAPTPAAAVAYDAGRIVAVGGAAEVAAAAGPNADVVRLGGRCVVPGFVDAHHHLAAAVTYRGTVDCRPRAAPSLGDVAARLRAAAGALPAGAWVVGFGFDDFAVAERRPPTRRELDDACPEHPVLLVHFSFHQGVASSRALALAGIGRTTRDPPAGRIGRGARGEPDGQLFESALARVEALARAAVVARGSGESFLRRLEAYQRELFAAGITRLADPTVTRDVERLYGEARRAGLLRVAVVMMPVSESGYLLPPADRLDGPPTGEGESEALRVGPLKLFLDGGDNCAICLTPWQGAVAAAGTLARVVRARSLAPLRLARRVGMRLGRDLHFHTGLRYYPDDAELLRLTRGAVERGFAIAVHAMGNEAVAQALRLYAAVGARHTTLVPPRVEHAMLADDAQLRRARDLGAAMVVQPPFLSIPASAGVPPLPGVRLFGFRSMLDAGLHVAGSSDAPVAGFAPLDAFRDARFRRDAEGVPTRPEEGVTAYEALAMYTREGARACGSLTTAGTLEPGKRADLVVLSRDPCTATEDELRATRVLETVAGGTTVWTATEYGTVRSAADS